jgi:hypothetical protein
LIQRWLGLVVLRRAYRILTDDSRPLREHMTREAKRILVAAVILLVLLAAIVLALLYVLIRALT